MTSPRQNGMAMLAVAWRASRAKMSVAIVLTLASGAMWPLMALVIKNGVSASVAHDVRSATADGALVGLAAVGALTLKHFAWVPYAEACEQAALHLGAEVIELSCSAGLAHQESPDYADRVSVLAKELSYLPEAMTGVMTTLSLTVSLSITGFLLASVSPWLLLLPLIAIPPVLAARYAERVTDRAKLRAAPMARLSENWLKLSASANAAKEIRAYRLEREVRRRFAESWAGQARVLWAGEARATLVRSAGLFIFAIGYAAAVLLVLRQAVEGRSRIGDVVLVIVLAGQVNQQVYSGVELMRVRQRMGSGLARLDWLRGLVGDQRPAHRAGRVPTELRRGIEFRDVTFAYSDPRTPAISGISVLLPAGSTVAVVGENGAGKSTIAKLLCGFYDVTSGSIEVDGVDLRRLPADVWRDNIAASFQDFCRFELVARHSVGIGDLPRMDDEPQVVAALERAGAERLIDRLESGLSTQLGKSWADGAGLSGGQWQNVALGRGMMRTHPLLLIMDEPTSALDAEAEYALFLRYARIASQVGSQRGAITVLVSHRFSTVRMADLILVVDRGRLVEAGSHAELIALGGTYAELFNLQASAYT
ncbi:MAG TPA: ABC transporter ATP-binding protein [Acidothermaceae bacterium]